MLCYHRIEECRGSVSAARALGRASWRGGVGVRSSTLASRMPLYYARSGFFKSRPGFSERPVEWVQMKRSKVLRGPPPPPKPTPPTPSHCLPARPRGASAHLPSSRPPCIPASLRLSFTFLPARFLPIHFLSVLLPPTHPLFFPSPQPSFILLFFWDSGCLKRSVCLRGWMIDSRERARQLSGDR